MTKTSSFIDIVNGYNNNPIANTYNTKFLGIVTESSLSWEAHRDQLIPKLGTACYSITAIEPFMSQDTLKLVYYSYFHTLVNYEIIFWGILHIVFMSSDYKKGLLELSLGQDLQTLAENYLKN